MLFVKVAYQLRFIITRVPYKHLGIWQKRKTHVCFLEFVSDTYVRP